MGGQFGYEQIKKIAFLGLAFGEAMEDAAHSDTKMGKAIAFLSCVDEAATLITLDRDALKKEFGEFDEDDRAGLFQECKNEFTLDDKELEQRIEASIEAGFQILEGIEKAVVAWKGGISVI